MKFQVGDKIKCIESITDHEGGPKKGEEFIITSYNDSNNGIGIKLPRLSKMYSEGIKNGTVPNWGVSCFELVTDSKPVPKKIEPGTGWGFE